MGFRYKHGDRPLDGYTIQRGVGAGGFGEVYYAVSDGGRQVALKCLQYNQDIELRGVGQCMNLKSPYLVTIFDVKKAADGAAFVIMEYVTGPSLRDLLREAPGGLGPEKTAFLMREVAKGLGYLHERGIVHRDLKPENIFFEDGYVKIGDYGLSKYISVSRQSCQTISVGTVHYMAPEIGSGRYHRGIDIYALGVILYEMLSGRVPFTGDSFGEILMKHLTVEPDLSVFAPPFAGVIGKALAKNPDQRYPRVEEMTEDLLRSPEVQSWLRDFRPESLSRNGDRPELGETVVLGPQSPKAPPAEPDQKPPRGPADPAARGAGAEGGAAREKVPASLAISPPLEDALPSQAARHRVLSALVTAASMALAITLLTDRGFSGALGSFLVIVSGAFAVLVAEREGPGPLVFEPGLPRRLLTLCIASPLYLLFMNLVTSRSIRGSVLALILATALVSWRERIRADRLDRISLHHAFTAGLFGFLIALPLSGIHILVAGAMAAISLAVNIYSPFLSAAGGEPRKKSLAGAAKDAVHRRMEAVRSMVTPSSGAQALQSAEAPAEAPRPMASWARIFWSTLSALFLATSLSLFFFTLAALRDKWDVSTGLCFSIATLGYGLFTFHLGWGSFWPGFFRVARRFLITTFLIGAGCSAICLIALGLRDAEPALFFLIFCLVFALFLGLLPRRLTRDHGAARDVLPRAQSPGWSALGALLVTLGISITLGSALFASGILEGDGPGRSSRAQDFSRTFVESRMHFLAGLALFLPGLFCVLRSREELGATHVFRGAAGFGVVGVLVFLLSQVIFAGISSDHSGLIQFSQVRSKDIAGLFSLGVLGALLLFWPARGLPPRAQ